MTLIPIRLREVSTVHTIRSKGKTKTVIGIGTEIVEERAFCPEHVRRIEPIIEARLSRQQDRTGFVPTVEE